MESFVDRVDAVLAKFDVLSLIEFGASVNEYDIEAKRIANRIYEVSSIQDVLDLTHSVFVECFDEKIAGSKERYVFVAEEIWSVWLHYSKNRDS